LLLSELLLSERLRSESLLSERLLSKLLLSELLLSEWLLSELLLSEWLLSELSAELLSECGIAESVEPVANVIKLFCPPFISFRNMPECLSLAIFSSLV
jgi:hypothetical protein